MRTLVYTRVSTTDQAEEGTSLSSQLEACRRYGAARNYHIVGEYSDVHTGSQYRERPGLTELRNQVRAGVADVILCYALDRLSRDQMHVAVLIDEIEHNGARLELVTETFDDTPTGRLVRSVQSFVAEIEREKIVERTVRGKLERIRSGRLLPGRKALYGYQWNAGRDRYLIDPITAPVVQRIYRDYLAGHSLRSIAYQLHNEGIPTPTGKLKPWPITTVRVILAQARYTGKVTAWNGEIALSSELIPPLIDQAAWDRVQARLAIAQQRASRNNPNPERALLRGGIGKCGLCHGSLIAHRHHANWYGYVCSQRQRTCQRFSMATHKLDTAVMERIRRLFLDEGQIQLEAERALRSDDAGQLRAIQQRRSALEKQQAALSDAIALASDHDAITALVTRLEAISDQLRSLADEKRSLDMAAGLAEQRRRDLRDLLARREVVAANFDNLTYWERRDLLDGLKVTVYLWPTSRRPRWEIRSPVLEDIVFSSSRQYEHNTRKEGPDT